MAKLVKGGITYSNSHAAVADSFNTDDSALGGSMTLNLLSQGDPGSASLFSIGQTDTTTTYLPTGTSGQVAVPTDLIAQDGAGYYIFSDLGAKVTILNSSSVTYDTSTISATEQGIIDNLDASHSVTDHFLYAIRMADGTVSTSTVAVVISGHAGTIGLGDGNYYVVEDQHDGTGAITADGGNDPLLHGTLTDANFEVIATSASHHNDVGFTIAGEAGNWGGLNGTSGTGDQIFTYTVSDAYVYTHSTAGYEEVAHTDHFDVTANDGATATIDEVIYGNINAPTITSHSAAASDIDEGSSTALTIVAGDHDDNANLSATISGVPGDATLVYNDGSGPVTLDASGDLTGAQLAALASNTAALTLTAGEDDGAVALTVTVTNTEGSGSDTVSLHSSAVIDVTVHETADAPNLDVGAGNGSDNTVHVNEESTSALSIAASAAESDQNAPSITISGDGDFTLNHGTHNGDGSYTLAATDLSGLQITVGEDSTLHLTVTATDSQPDAVLTADQTASTVDHLTVVIDPVPEAPTLDLDGTNIAAGSTAGDAITAETTGMVGVPNAMMISGADPDSDGTVSFTISNIPDDVTLSNDNGTIAHVGGSATLQQADLAGLTVTATAPGDITFQVDAQNSEGGDTIGFVHWPVTAPVTDLGGPTGIGFAMNPQTGDQLDHLGNFFQIGDPDAGDTFTYSVGAGSASGFAVDPVTGVLDATSAAAGTDDLLNVVATDAANNSTTMAFHVWIDGTNGGSTHTALFSANNIDDGLQGNDNLFGSAGTDYLFGGSDIDHLQGNGGADFLVGGNGADHFVYAASSDSTHSAFDTILGFTPTTGSADILDFVNVLGLTGTPGSLGPVTGATSLAGHAVGWTFVGSDAVVYANTGSSAELATTGTDVMEIHLTGVSSLSSADFNLHA